MFHRRVRSISYMLELITQNSLQKLIGGASEHSYGWYLTRSNLTVLPGKLNKSEKKPLARGFKNSSGEARLKRKERENVKEIKLHPPDNGLLVKGLIPVAHKVYSARAELSYCVSRVFNTIAIYSRMSKTRFHVSII